MPDVQAFLDPSRPVTSIRRVTPSQSREETRLTLGVFLSDSHGRHHRHPGSERDSRGSGGSSNTILTGTRWEDLHQVAGGVLGRQNRANGPHASARIQASTGPAA